MVERGPEKAGVGSSILLLGINEATDYVVRGDDVIYLAEFIPSLRSAFRREIQALKRGT